MWLSCPSVLLCVLLYVQAGHGYTWQNVTEWGDWPDNMLFFNSKKYEPQGVCRVPDEAVTGRALRGYCWLPAEGAELAGELPFQVLATEPLLEQVYWAGMPSREAVKRHGVLAQAAAGDRPAIYVCAANDIGPGKLALWEDEPAECLVGHEGKEKVFTKGYQVLMAEDPNVHIITEVEYRLDELSLLANTPVKMAETTILNFNDFTQAVKRTMDITKTSTSSWEHGLGFSPYTHIKVSAGIPHYAHKTWVVDKEGNYTYNPGNVHFETFHASIEASVKVPANSKCQLQVVARQMLVDIPYSAKLQTIFWDGSSRSDVITGYYKGMSVNQEEVQYEKCVPIDN